MPATEMTRIARLNDDERMLLRLLTPEDRKDALVRAAREKAEGAMLNEAAKKLVARAARVEARERGAPEREVTDALIAEAFEQALVSNPDFRSWSGARPYFETVFISEFDRASGGSPMTLR